MTRRLYLVFVLFLVASLILSACSSKKATATLQPAAPTAGQSEPLPATVAPADPSAKKPDLLRVWVEWGDDPPWVQSVFDQYTQQTGIKVEVNAPAPLDKILAALSGSEPPDIVVTSQGNLAQSLAYQGLTEDLKPAAANYGIDLNDIYPSAMVQCQQDDHLVCLPWGIDTFGLYWNKDLFEDAGLDPEKPPKTLDELYEYARKLTKVDASGNVTQLGFMPDYPYPLPELYMHLYGGNFYGDQGKTLTVNAQPLIDSLTWEQAFYELADTKKILDLRSGFGDYASPEVGFYSGKLAMVVEGEWQLGPNWISKYKPELNYGVAPVPVLASKPEMYGSSLLFGTVVVIPTNGKNKEAAYQLLAWMESPQVIADVMHHMANLPTSKKAAEDPRFKEIKHFDLFIGIMAHPLSTGIGYSPIHQEMYGILLQYEQEILQAGADVKSKLDDLQAQFEPKLKEAFAKLK